MAPVLQRNTVNHTQRVISTPNMAPCVSEGHSKPCRAHLTWCPVLQRDTVNHVVCVVSASNMMPYVTDRMREWCTRISDGMRLHQGSVYRKIIIRVIYIGTVQLPTFPLCVIMNV